MPLSISEKLEPSPRTGEILAVLGQAMGDRGVPAARRVLVSGESRSPDEGLALLNAYVVVADPAVRQAILDAVIAIAGTRPEK